MFRSHEMKQRSWCSPCIVLPASLALAWLLGACDSDTTTDSSATATCAAALGTSPAGCPDTTRAESAWNTLKSTCGVADSDLDVANRTLNASAKPKLCSTCDCRKAVYDYETAYANCTGEDEANTMLAKNLYDIAAACK